MKCVIISLKAVCIISNITTVNNTGTPRYIIELLWLVFKIKPYVYLKKKNTHHYMTLCIGLRKNSVFCNACAFLGSGMKVFGNATGLWQRVEIIAARSREKSCSASFWFVCTLAYHA